MKILYDDCGFVVFEKDPGTDSEKIRYQDLYGPGAEGTLYCVHRLDKETGGVTVYAKNEKTAAVLSEGFQKREIRKTYLALSEGCPENDTGEMKDLLFHDRRTNKTYVTDRERRGVKKASLSYEVLEKNIGPHKLSLVKVELHTGRTHQIRVQFASRKMPLAGDRRYGAKTVYGRGIGLWSHMLRMIHPDTGEELFFVSEFPKMEKLVPQEGDISF